MRTSGAPTRVRVADERCEGEQQGRRARAPSWKVTLGVFYIAASYGPPLCIAVRTDILLSPAHPWYRATRAIRTRFPLLACIHFHPSRCPTIKSTYTRIFRKINITLCRQRFRIINFENNQPDICVRWLRVIQYVNYNINYTSDGWLTYGIYAKIIIPNAIKLIIHLLPSAHIDTRDSQSVYKSQSKIEICCT